MKMFLKKRMKQAVIFVLAAMMAAALYGCGEKKAENGTEAAAEYPEGMKEFANDYDTFFIHLGQDWSTIDVDYGFILAASNEDYSEWVKIEQAFKDINTDITSVDDWKQIIEDAYGISDVEAADAIEVPGMRSVSVYNVAISSDEYKQNACIVYGETDYAYYAILYAADEMDDEKKTAFEASCSTFREGDKVEYLKDMCSFVNGDRTASIYLNQDWDIEDIDDESFNAGSEDDSEGVVLIQIPKDEATDVVSIDDFKQAVEQNFEMSDIEGAETIEVPGMTSVSVYNAAFNTDGYTVKVYMVYGETDYAYYFIGFMSDEMNDEKKAAFAASCSTFREETAMEYLKDMKEFANGYQTAFIHLNQDWSTADGGSDCFIGAVNENSGETVFLLQFPKNDYYSDVSVDDIKQWVEQLIGLSDVEAAEAIEIPGMTSVSADNATASSDGYTRNAYVVYGETDYAYYSIAYMAYGISDKQKAAFEASCSTFREGDKVKYLKDMKTYTNGYHTVSIRLNQDWSTIDDDDFLLAAENEDSSEWVQIQQAPKNVFASITSMDDLKQAVEEAYGISDIEAADVIEIPGMTSVSVCNGTIGNDEKKQNVYIVYGETDYAYYVMEYAADEMNDEKKAAFEASCSTFQERDEVKYLKDMVEFANGDNTAFIHLNQDWDVENGSDDRYLAAESGDNSEGVSLIQILKNDLPSGAGVDDIKRAIEQIIEMTDIEEAEAIEVPGMTSVSVYNAVINIDEYTRNACIVYGETDYALYAVIYGAEEMNDEKKAAFAASCFTFREETVMEYLKDMKEFANGDNTAFIHLNQDWSTMDAGSDSIISARNENNSEGVNLYQFPKNEFHISGMDDLKQDMEEGHGLSDIEAADAIEVPGMTSVSVYNAAASNDDGHKLNVYIVYGETDYAYYVIEYIAGEIDDKKKAAFAASCSTFREETP